MTKKQTRKRGINGLTPLGPTLNINFDYRQGWKVK